MKIHTLEHRWAQYSGEDVEIAAVRNKAGIDTHTQQAFKLSLEFHGVRSTCNTPDFLAATTVATGSFQSSLDQTRANVGQCSPMFEMSEMLSSVHVVQNV